MNLDTMRLRGVRQNNLRGIDLDLPKRSLIVVVGISGSGKSSLVFDTIAAEAQRQINATFSAFSQNYLPSYGRPDADRIENLSACVVIDRRRLPGGPRSTLATITDIGDRFRIASPAAACRTGRGRADGGPCAARRLRGRGGPFPAHPPAQGGGSPEGRGKGGSGALVRTGPCTACHGTRLNEAARTATVEGLTLPQAYAMQVGDLAGMLRTWDLGALGGLVSDIVVASTASSSWGSDTRTCRGKRPPCPVVRPSG